MTLTVAARAPRLDAGRLRFVLLVALLMITLAMLGWTVSFPGVPFGWIALSLLSGVVCVVLTVGLLRRHAGRVNPLLVLGSVVVTVALGVGVAVSDTPRSLRFQASRPALERVVAGHVPPSFADRETFGRFPGECPPGIGAYAIVDCRAFPGGFLFLQRENAVTDDSGIAWIPDGPPRQGSGNFGLDPSGFTHLDGPWYVWSCYC
jgi:hypothetical protein